MKHFATLIYRATELATLLMTAMAFVSRGVAALSLALNLFFLAVIGFGAAVGLSQLPTSLNKLLYDTMQTANFTITFLVLLLLTLAGGLTARSQNFELDNPRRVPAKRAGELMFACAYTLLIALGLAFTLRVVNLQTLGTDQGFIFELLRFTAGHNPALSVVTGLAAAWYFLMSVIFTEFSLNPWQHLLPNATPQHPPSPQVTPLTPPSSLVPQPVLLAAAVAMPVKPSASAKPLHKRRGKNRRR